MIAQQTTVFTQKEVGNQPDVLQLDINVHKAQHRYQLSLDRGKGGAVITANRDQFHEAVKEYVRASGMTWREKANTQFFDGIAASVREVYAHDFYLNAYFVYHTERGS